MADDMKAKGNAAFSSGKFEEAIDHYTQAITADGTNHVLYSNRSACQASLKKWDEALQDAQKCVELKPDFAKGYSRLGSALYGQSKYGDAKDAYQKGLDIDSSNQQLQQGLQAAEDALAGASGGGGGAGGLFGPSFMAKLAMNPETRQYMNQPDFKSMVDMCGKNPSLMTNFMQDKRFAKALEVGLGISLGFSGDGGANMATGGDDGDEVDGPGLTGTRAERSAPKPAPAPPPAPEPELSEEEKAAKEQKERALEEKNKGNAAYKQRNFDDAIAHYDKAIELFDQDISFITNRAAVHYEKKDYDEAIKDCETAVEKGRQIRPIDFKLIAKAMTRHGNCLLRKDDYDGAIEMFNRSLTEHRTPEALKARDAAEKTLKTRKAAAYIDLDKAEEARQLGNEAFKGAEYPKAIEHYSEALKRGPPGKWDDAYKLFSNRAACYTKLGALPQAEKDADMCIELQPAFAKGYIRKAHVQFFTKEYEKALETYEAGLKQEPGNAELVDGKMRCQQAMARFMNGMATDEEVQERQARAMSDPQIQTIMTDPVMQQVLKECQESPGSISKHMQNPGIAAKLKKLMTAGIIRVA